MTVDMQRYTELLQDFAQILQTYIDQETLDKLKTEYKEKINSKRVLENIVDINSLLKVLEKRGLLHYNEISVLQHIAKDYVQDQSIDDLILNYKQWSTENLTDINDLYSCGKSSNLIINREYKNSNAYKTENLCDILPANVPNLESEDQCNESLLSKESNVTPNEQKKTNKKNILNSTFVKKCSIKYKKKKYIFIIIVTLLLLILTISVIGILVKLSYLSAAIVPELEQQRNTSLNQVKPNMPLLMSNVNLEFSANHSQTSTSATPISTAKREKELQTLVVNKISRKIGKYWAEVSRRLDIEESDVDEIENRYIGEIHSHEKMFKEALKIYFSEENSNWKKDLMRALESSKRKDLKEEVEKIVY